MSLLETESQECVLITYGTVPDGEGGEIARYMEAAHFDAIVTGNNYRDNTKNLGNTETPAGSVKVFYPKSIKLGLNDIFKTVSDGKIYKISSDSPKCVKSSNIPFQLTSAEEWRLPND